MFIPHWQGLSPPNLYNCASKQVNALTKLVNLHAGKQKVRFK